MITFIRWYKMKAKEVKIKLAFYSMITGILDNQKDIIELVQKMYMVLKDVHMEDLRSELIKQIASMAHEQAVKEREAEKSE